MALEVNSERFVESGENQRWKLNTPIQIYIRDDLPHLAGHSKDISMTGIQIEIGVKLPINAMVTIEIFFQRPNVFDFIEQTPLRMKAQVLWRRPIDHDSEAWETGLRFVNISRENRAIIEDEVTLMEPFIQNIK